MRVETGLAGAEFTLLARCSTTGGTTGSEYFLLAERLFHGDTVPQDRQARMVNFARCGLPADSATQGPAVAIADRCSNEKAGEGPRPHPAVMLKFGDGVSHQTRQGSQRPVQAAPRQCYSTSS